MLRNSEVNERIFNETQTTGELDFRFKEELQPIDNVGDLAENMQLYSETVQRNGQVGVNRVQQMLGPLNLFHTCSITFVHFLGNNFVATTFGADVDGGEHHAIVCM